MQESAAIRSATPSPVGRWLTLLFPLLLLSPAAGLIVAWQFPFVFSLLPAWFFTVGIAIYLVIFLLSPFILFISALTSFAYFSEWKERGKQGDSLAVAVLWLGPVIFYVTLIGGFFFLLLTRMH